MSAYHDYGFFNEEAAHTHAYLEQPMLKLLGSNKSQYILDLGCGNGAMVRFLLKQGYIAYGTDASEQGIAIARKRHPEHFAVQDLSIDALPDKLAGIPFNTIISTEVIEHLYNPRLFIAFCRKILLQYGGGNLILSTPYHGYLKNLALAIAGKWDAHANPLWDGGHIKLWSRKTLTQALEEQGFTVTDFLGCGRFPGFWKSMMIKARIGGEGEDKVEKVMGL